ncbi:MAG: bifunctional tetrahydrofolate synthase/dihydrofolate synthase [Methylophaga sp.]|nr:bifunctional tetrahydrofolate synthase/dihydrofolate synthase [Methylophaga sp.]
MRFETLPEWLQWQEELHFTKVDPGLTRIGHVWSRLGGTSNLPFTVVTVAGTNGKGSSVAMLSSILREAGYNVGTYTSPHLLEYNERICLNSIPCNDELICKSFDRIDIARNEISLTYFEFATLAAVDIFCEQKIDIAILEVGMGGRLDATNLFDCNIALITPISLDHMNWLGTNREQIGAEKAGIICRGAPVVSTESLPPQSILDHAKTLKAPLYHAERDYKYVKDKDCWHWSSEQSDKNNVSLPRLVGNYQLQNAAAVLQVIELLNSEKGYAVSDQHINQGLESVKLAGRFQRIAGDIEQIFDVTHNQKGAENLAKLLAEIPCEGRTIAVLAMLKDKDPRAVIKELKLSIDNWYVAGLGGNRGMSGAALAAVLAETIPKSKIVQKEQVIEAYKTALKNAMKGDRVLVLGSFQTVEAVMKSRLT